VTRHPSFCPVVVLGALLSVVVGLAGCASSPRLRLDPSRAEFPYGGPVDVDGRVDTAEWAAARRIEVDLPEGRRVEIFVQRDREHFQFAFVGLDGAAVRAVQPEVLLDLWGNRASTWDTNDWWIRIGLDDCWARGGWGEGDCAQVLTGLEATNFPLAPGQAIEVTAEFREMEFDENYDALIGLAFRFVDDRGVPVAVWPLRAEVEDPSTWAPVSLSH